MKKMKKEKNWEKEKIGKIKNENGNEKWKMEKAGIKKWKNLEKLKKFEKLKKSERAGRSTVHVFA